MNESNRNESRDGPVLTRREALGGLGAGLAAAVLSPSAAVAAAPARVGRVAALEGVPVTPLSRCQHTTIVMHDGRILVAGGYHHDPLTSAQIFDPHRGVWFAAASLSTPRARHAAVALGDGRVMVVGGLGANPLSSAEIYYPATDTWVQVASMPTPREDPAAALLPDGRVMVFGGFHRAPLAGALVYDAGSDSWLPLE